MILKRLFDLFFSLVGLVFLSPVFAAVAVWIRMDSPGPVFFRQIRVGRFGRPFRIFKFRTMLPEPGSRGRQVTVGEDPRITRAGRFLRRYKLDELPQLLNVATGEMSLVGPRPEVPRYMEKYPPDVRERVLSVPPGITDFASLEFRNEASILAGAADPEAAYIGEILPIKWKLYERYVTQRSLGLDLRLIIATLKAIVSRT